MWTHSSHIACWFIRNHWVKRIRKKFINVNSMVSKCFNVTGLWWWLTGHTGFFFLDLNWNFISAWSLPPSLTSCGALSANSRRTASSKVDCTSSWHPSRMISTTRWIRIGPKVIGVSIAREPVKDFSSVCYRSSLELLSSSSSSSWK